jgi:hypothetical protein
MKKEDEEITNLNMIADNDNIDMDKPQLILPDGKYYGDIENNERNGQGVMKYTNGDEYIGNWENNERNGMGIMKWAVRVNNIRNTDPFDSEPKIYVGEFKNDEFNGHGKLKYNNSFTYIGKWKDGMRNGYGLYYISNLHHIGDWENNKFKNGTIYRRKSGFMDDPNRYYNEVEYYYKGKIKSSLPNTYKSMDYYL